MKFSIITPCYKCAKYVRETLDSVRTQKVADWELICIDDGSPDETGRVLDDYLREHCAAVTESERVIKAIGDEDRHPDAPKRILAGELPSGARMTVVHQLNCGVSGARNTALTLATGERVVFLDGDDLLSPWALELVERSVEKVPNVDIVEGGVVNFTGQGTFGWGECNGLVTVQDVSSEIPSDPFNGSFQRFVFRRELIGNIAYKGVSCTEELGYMVRCFIRARLLAKTNDAFYGYRILVGSMSHQSVSFNRCVDAYDVTRSATRMIFESQKHISACQWRQLINRWSEMQVDLISLLATPEERARAWTYWWEKLPKVKRYRIMCTRWQWATICVCTTIHSRLLAFVFFYIPHWLKTKGVHR